MAMTAFDYHRPKTLETASKLLLEHKNSMILAGGTDLFVKMRKGSHRPDVLIDVKSIQEVSGFAWEEGRMFIGAAVTWTEIKMNEAIRKYFPALHQAACNFGCQEIRNRATIGGNICSASPGAESGGPGLVYDASVKLWKKSGERIIPLKDFMTGPGQTALLSGEIMTGLLLPKPPENCRSAYRRTARVRGQDLATCAITVMAVNPDIPPTREIRVALSAVLKTASRPPELEEILSKKRITSEVLEKAKTWLRDNLHPRASSLRGTPDYKREAMGGMLQILIEELSLNS